MPRSAKTGKYVSKSEAAANPDTTVKDNDWAARKLKQITKAWLAHDPSKMNNLLTQAASRMKLL